MKTRFFFVDEVCRNVDLPLDEVFKGIMLNILLLPISPSAPFPTETRRALIKWRLDFTNPLNTTQVCVSKPPPSSDGGSFLRTLKILHRFAVTVAFPSGEGGPLAVDEES